MALRTVLVIVSGQEEQLQQGDSFLYVGTYTPGSFTISDGTFVNTVKRLTLTGSQRMTAQGTGRLRIN